MTVSGPAPRVHRPTVTLVLTSGLLTLAAAVVLRTPAHTTQDAVVVSREPAVCLQLEDAEDQVCFDAEHVAHLSLAALRVGQCVTTTRSGAADAAVLAEAFTVVRAAPPTTCT